MIGAIVILWQPVTGLVLIGWGAWALRRAMRPRRGPTLRQWIYDRLIWPPHSDGDAG